MILDSAMTVNAVIAEQAIQGNRVIDDLEKAMLDMPQTEMEPVHIFADGLYLRQLTIPAGVLLTGRVHRHPCLIFVSRGSIRVMDPEAGVKHLTGPALFESKAGARRMGYACEETVFTTIHANPQNERDVEKLESDLFEPSAVHDELQRRKLALKESAA